jgi:hypothetical protein
MCMRQTSHLALICRRISASLMQGTPESAVGVFCEAARKSGALFAAHKGQQQAANGTPAAKQLVGV